MDGSKEKDVSTRSGEEDEELRQGHRARGSGRDFKQVLPEDERQWVRTEDEER